MAVTVVFDSPLARIGHVGPLVVTHFKEATTLEVLDEMQRLQDEIVKSHGKIYSLTLIGRLGATLNVEEGVRRRSVEMSARFETQGRGTAIVLLARGLATIAIRSFLTGYFLLSRSPAPTRTFSHPAEGLAFLQTLPDADLALKTVAIQDIELFLAP